MTQDFILSVMAGVLANAITIIISKWLDGKRM